MKRWAVGFALMGSIIGMLLTAPNGGAASKVSVKRSTLGVPSYPGWTIHRLDDQVDSVSNAYVYQRQYYSNDPAQDIVRFYEERMNATASFTESSHTYTIDAPDRAMIQITSPPDGVPETSDDGEPTGTTWTALITILRFETR